MFESLTKHLPELEKAEGYGRAVTKVEQAIYAFADEHPEYELPQYANILERNGLEWSGRTMSEADVSQLDGQAVMALLLGAVRADRFCDGALIGFFEDGSVRRWIARLREIDSACQGQVTDTPVMLG